VYIENMVPAVLTQEILEWVVSQPETCRSPGFSWRLRDCKYRGKVGI